MPFIGQDWRSPGEVWIKIEEGWERMKLLRTSHIIRHQGCLDSKSPLPIESRTASYASTSLSSSPSSSIEGCSTDSDSDCEAVVPSDLMPSSLTPVPEKDSELGVVDLCLPTGSPEPDVVVSSSVAEIIERLQKSSSHPIPLEILKESSNQIETCHTQPYYRITINQTREVAGSNIISDAFYKLDFCNAIRDIRRFAYVSKLLHLLITQNLTSLSGNATKALFWMLEEIAKQVATNKQNIHVIRQLLVELREIVDKYLCWGRPLGSTQLWDQHLRTMERICEMTDSIEIKPFQEDGKPTWSELPEELIREILLRLSDYKDLERSSQACERMQSLLNEEQHIWKQLVKYHFTKENLKWASNVITEQQIQFDSKTCDVDWEQLFHLLRKKFGLKEEYTDCLFLCRYCRCLFWKSKGHPCILENPELTSQLSSPETVLQQPKKLPFSCENRIIPVAVQNIPLFEHPLVLQRLNNLQQQQQRSPDNGERENVYPKAPPLVPITPHAFLKFFSL